MRNKKKESLGSILFFFPLYIANAFGHDVAGILQNDKGVTVDVSTKDGPKQFTAAYLVGADGGRSFVRSAVGVSFDGFTWPQQIVATNVVYPFEKYGYSTGNQIV